QIIVHYTLHQKTNDIHTLKPHLDSFEYLYENLPEVLTADAGYGSEENYEYLESKGIETYVKYNTFERRKVLPNKGKINEKVLDEMIYITIKNKIFMFVRWDSEWKK